MTARPQRRLVTLAQTLTRRIGLPALVFLALILVARAMLPYIVRDYVNRKLAHMEGYRGQIDRVQINLYRGAYTIFNLRLFKTDSPVSIPFIALPEMDLSLEWPQLFRGSLVGEITLNRPQLNFIASPAKEQQQTGAESSDWKATLQTISPFTINRFQINNGSIRFFDQHKKPAVDLYVTNLFATATNLTNVRQKNIPLPAGLIANANTIGGGKLKLELRMNPLANKPTFKLLATLSKVNLRALNSYMRAYGGFDVEHGSFALLVDVAAANQRYHGYAKPFFFNLQVFNPASEEDKNLLGIIWEAVVAAISQLFRNQPENQLATVIPISGSFENDPNVDLWTTIGGILQNAFVQALSPTFVQTVPLPDTSTARAPPG